MVPVSMALVADLFPPEKRALPLGIVGAVDTAGWVLGHLYGGIMVQFMTWPYLFWINLPIIAVMFVVTWWGLAGLPRADAKGGIDWIGVTLLGIALVLRQCRPGLAGNRFGRVDEPSAESDVLGRRSRGRLRDLFDFTAPRQRTDPQSEHLLQPQCLRGDGVNLLVGFCIMVALVSVPIFINRRRRCRRHEPGGVGDRLPALCVHSADGTGGNSWRLAFVAVRLSLVRHLRPRCRRRWLPDDEFLESRDGEAGGRVLCRLGRTRTSRSSWELDSWRRGWRLRESASD